MNVYSYFEHINDVALPVIELWRESWSAHGWNPVVLNEEHFFSWSEHEAFDAAVSRFPTINNPAYERACFRRWGAMVAVGGELLTDYDVMNYGFRMEHLPPTWGKCVLLDAYSPCVTTGTTVAFAAACKVFSEYQVTEADQESGCPHVSDMHIINRLCPSNEFIRRVVCKEINEPGWETASLVHFASLKTNKPKRKAILEHGPFVRHNP